MPENEGSWEDDIAADWKAIQEREPEPEPETVDNVLEPETAQERARDEHGRFTKAEQAAAEAAAVEAPEKVPEATVVEQPAGIDLNRPPASWKPAAKSQWAALTPEIRAEVYRREQDFLKGHSELRPDADLGRNIRQVVEPYRMLIEAEGGTPETAIGSLLRTAAIFRVGTADQKQAALSQIAQQYGIPMPQIGGEFSNTPAPDYKDPRVDQLFQHLQQEKEREVNSVIDRWKVEADAQGQPLRPYLDNVYPEMVAIIPSIQEATPGLSHTEVLQQAYDRAAWANPEVRQVLLQQAEAKRREETLRRTAEARKAASVNMPRRGAVPTQAPVGSMDDTIRENARNLGFIN